jgi:hypothetical protein
MANYDKISYILDAAGYKSDPNGLAFNTLKSCPICILKMLVNAYRKISILESRIKEIESDAPLGKSGADFQFGGPGWALKAYPAFCGYAISSIPLLFKDEKIITVPWMASAISRSPGAILMVAEQLAVENRKMSKELQLYSQKWNQIHNELVHPFKRESEYQKENNVQ